ncbi:VOC family protein [Pistricoccus aurantiacus]|uniref:VOC family protein n=1 Tax=Pistricoccus aurantiacus TaxID=1883414 RepID=A0A5B8STH4_9GAMM|nr:VOC family protein [Pistricoccus aurantiacus]QEA39634.1 VOC family protein [Pistricoccus aurantiacus]
MRILVNIDVPDLAPAIAFYTAALGLTHSRTLDEDVAELTGASSVIYLLKTPSGSKAASTLSERRTYSRHWTPVHLDFVVEDTEEATERALGAGANRESEYTEWRGSKCVTFSDPFGHGFCLIEFAEETYREVQLSPNNHSDPHGRP